MSLFLRLRWLTKDFIKWTSRDRKDLKRLKEVARRQDRQSKAIMISLYFYKKNELQGTYDTITFSKYATKKMNQAYLKSYVDLRKKGETGRAE